ncbi:MerR family transcriptional regulator [Sphingomonas humi]|uniref:HTH merR-type domain-containing protein n=1 Tax=Sphingomonas humi TaxID=335630 RepID=A0ABP7RP41_9SPHN
MPAPSGTKDPAAFRTIGEVSAELGIAQHILRYWESRFPQLKPLQRAGNRRYYRPEDVELVRRIHHLLTSQGYTVRGVQQLLKGKEPLPEPPPVEEGLVDALKRVRAELTAAIS